MYLVLEEFDHLGRAYGETDEARADRDTMIRDLISGQYDKPVRIVAFNTAKEWPGVGMRPISASFELPGIEPLAAIGITFILLVLPHYIIIVEYSAPLRGVSTAVPLVFGFLCRETTWRYSTRGRGERFITTTPRHGRLFAVARSGPRNRRFD